MSVPAVHVRIVVHVMIRSTHSNVNVHQGLLALDVKRIFVSANSVAQIYTYIGRYRLEYTISYM